MSTGWKVLAAVGGVLILVALLVAVFALGARFGEARFYREGLPGVPPPAARVFLAAHGILGTVEQVDLQARMIDVRNERGAHALVLVGDDTLLEQRGRPIDLAQVKAGDWIVVIGTPDVAGQITARAVRMLGGRDARPAPLWSGLARCAYRVYRFFDLLRGLSWRRGS